MLEMALWRKQKLEQQHREAEGRRICRQWAEKNGLKRAGGSQCVHRLVGKTCRRHGVLVQSVNGEMACLPPGNDHESLWSKGGVPSVFVFQPYQIEDQNLILLARFCEQNGLRASITTWPAWHYPGRVLHVEITRKDS